MYDNGELDEDTLDEQVTTIIVGVIFLIVYITFIFNFAIWKTHREMKHQH